MYKTNLFKNKGIRMKYLKFDSSHVIEDVNGSFLIAENGEALSVPFEVFFKGIILVDDRWGKSVKLLTLLMETRDSVKELSFNDNKENKILELSDEAWELACEIAENPAAGYNILYANALLKHVKDLKNASSIKPELT
jgi:hypothetical protein